MTFTDNGDGTATLAGTPAAGTSGVYHFTIDATNGVNPDATQSFTLTVDVSPGITRRDHTTFTEGQGGHVHRDHRRDCPTAAVTETGGAARRGHFHRQR